MLTLDDAYPCLATSILLRSLEASRSADEGCDFALSKYVELLLFYIKDVYHGVCKLCIYRERNRKDYGKS